MKSQWPSGITCRGLSLSSWGAWIEILYTPWDYIEGKVSLSSWGAWIEIIVDRSSCFDSFCRSPHGERGLKFMWTGIIHVRNTRRSPHGERGLKCC